MQVRKHTVNCGKSKGTAATSTGEGGRGVLDPALEVRHEKPPPHGCTWDGAVHRPRIPRRPRRRREGRWRLTAESTGALGAESFLSTKFTRRVSPTRTREAQLMRLKKA